MRRPLKIGNVVELCKARRLARTAGRCAAAILLAALVPATSACQSTREDAARPFPARLTWSGVSAAQVREVAGEELRALGLELDLRTASESAAPIATTLEGVYPETGWHTRLYSMDIESEAGTTTISIHVVVRFDAYDRNQPSHALALRDDAMAHVIREMESLAAAMDRRLGPSVVIRKRIHWVESERSPRMGVRFG